MDRYIDNTETQTYGPALRRNLDAAFASSPKETRATVAYLISLQKLADESIAKAMTTARGAGADFTGAALAKGPELEAARKLLAGISQHLKASRDLGEWSGTLTAFFPKGLSGISTAADVLHGLHTVHTALVKDTSVPNGKKLEKRVADAEKKLATLVAKSSGATLAARKGLSEQSTEKKSWLRTYRSISLVVEGLLGLEGRQKELATIIPHLAVSGGRKAKPAAAKGGTTGATTSAPAKTSTG